MMGVTPRRILDGRFEILELMSRGAQARVFKAREIKDDRLVAVKLISAADEGFADGARRLANEAAILRSLSGLPAFMEPVAHSATDTRAYIAMEWLDGALDGADFIKTNSPMEMQTWLWVAKKLTSAVFECHQRGLLHRDLKPQNVLITTSGALKLIDFGIAHDQSFMTLGEGDVNLGTLPYVPPEQLARGEVGVPGEIFALGATLYEFLTSSVPFKADSPGKIMELKAAGRFVLPSEINPGSPQWVDRLMVRMLDPGPERRPQGAREVLSLLAVGDRAVVGENETSLRACRECGEMLWRELPFCTHCGAPYRLRVDRGQTAVIAERIQDTKLFIRELEEATGRRISAASARRFNAPCPRVLVDGIDEASAKFIADTLRSQNSLLRATRVDLLKRLSLARLSVTESMVAGVMALILAVTLLSIPFSSSIEEHGVLSVLFGRSGILCVLCLVVIGFIVREAFASLVPRDAFAFKRRKRKWSGLGDIRETLPKITDRGLRRRASALVRRATLLFDYVAAQRVSAGNKGAMVDGLSRLIRDGLQRLLQIDKRSQAAKGLNTSGIAKQRSALEDSLSRVRDPGVIDRITTKLGELERRESVVRTVARDSTLDETVFCSILSEINSLHVTMKELEMSRWQAELTGAAARFQISREDSHVKESGRH